MTNKPKNIIVLSVLVAFLTGCVSARAQYDIGLSEVERPVKAKERYGEQKISKVNEGGAEQYIFEDEMVKILWIPTSSQIGFSLTNKTDHSIKIVWDEAAYVDEKGTSHRVMHSGVKFIDRDNPKPPSVVVRKGNIADMVYPTDYAYFVTGQYGGWRELPLFPDKMFDPEGEKKLKTMADSYIGKTIQVLLPLQIEDIVNEYIFTFKVNSVKLETSR